MWVIGAGHANSAGQIHETIVGFVLDRCTGRFFSHTAL